MNDTCVGNNAERTLAQKFDENLTAREKLFQSVAEDSSGRKGLTIMSMAERAQPGGRVPPGPDHGPDPHGPDPHDQQFPKPLPIPPLELPKPEQPRSGPKPEPPRPEPPRPVPRPDPRPELPWQNLDLNAQDRLAQAGIALAEQALVEQIVFSNSSAFPDKTGRMGVTQTGTVLLEISNGGFELVNTNARIDRDNNFGQIVTQITDPTGRNIQNIDQRWKGNYTHTYVNDSHNSVILSIDGVGLSVNEAVNSSLGSFKDDTSRSVEANRSKAPLQINFSAVNQGNDVLDITATLLNTRPVFTPDGSPKPPSTIEVIIKVDPNKTSATYKLKSIGF